MKKEMLFLLILSFSHIQGSSFGEESVIYGRDVIEIDKDYIESFRPETPFPAEGEPLSPEWRYYIGLNEVYGPRDPSWSPDGRSIAFATWHGVWIVQESGGIPECVYDRNRTYKYREYYISEPGTIQSVCFSPDGSEIFFDTSIIDEEAGTTVTPQYNDGIFSGCSITGSIPVIMAVDIETGETRIVKRYANSPQFSRDGRYFSYKNIYSGNFIEEYGTGSGWKVNEGMYTFNHNGYYIIYGNNGQFYRRPVRDAGDPEQISFDMNPQLYEVRAYPDCSPNDNLVIFDGDGGQRSYMTYDEKGKARIKHSIGISKLCVLFVESGFSLPVFPVEDDIESTKAKFSPDGNFICYLRTNYASFNDNWHIYVQEFGIYSDMEPEESDTGPSYVAEESPTPSIILQNYPNPFNQSTTIEYLAPEEGFSNLVIYTIMGQKVRNLATGYRTAGIHSIAWDGCDDHGIPVSAGVYVSRLTMNELVSTGRMTLLK